MIDVFLAIVFAFGIFVLTFAIARYWSEGTRLKKKADAAERTAHRNREWLRDRQVS